MQVTDLEVRKKVRSFCCRCTRQYDIVCPPDFVLMWPEYRVI
jgi:hypothetical protein